jgi:hypothetical protein
MASAGSRNVEMMDDPIVAEVRKARDDYAKRFNYDLDAICQDLQQKQMQSGRKLVSFPPKRPKRVIVPRTCTTAQRDAGPDSEQAGESSQS